MMFLLGLILGIVIMAIAAAVYASKRFDWSEIRLLTEDYWAGLKQEFRRQRD